MRPLSFAAVSCLLAAHAAAAPTPANDRILHGTSVVAAAGAGNASSSSAAPSSVQKAANGTMTAKSSRWPSPFKRIPAAATPSFGNTSSWTPPGATPSPPGDVPPGTTGNSSTANQTLAGGPTNGYSSSLYFTNWGIYGANFQPQQIPASKVTRILYAFADIGSDGTVKSSDSYADLEKHYPTDSWNDQGKNAYGCVKQLYLLKKQHRQLKVLLSVGGWTYSPKFPPVAATEAGRQTFASTAVQLVADWGFDGIDIDWEYPASSAEARDFVLLLQAVRAALDRYAAANAPGYHFLVTVASPAGPKNYNAMDMAGMDPYVDAWNLMAYDYAGAWDTTTGHQANIYPNPSNALATKFSTEQAVSDYLAMGLAPGKIMIGLPLYGRSFEATDGLGLAYTGVGAGSTQAGIWLYKDLPRPGAVEAYDAVAQASYSYDSAARELISYDNVVAARQKSAYLAHRGLGGAVFWEASGDRNDSLSLIGTVSSKLGRLDASPNLLDYPASQYDNIRCGVPDS